jgi:putative ABC transport system permease protein
MSFLQAFKMAMKAILSNKMRSFLTMLGVIIGVVSVIALVSIGQGATSSVTESIEGMGSNLISITLMGRSDVNITNEDIEELKADEAIKYIAPLQSASYTVQAGSENDSYTVEATNDEYFEIKGYELIAGRGITPLDSKYRLHSAILGVTVATDLFGTTSNILGEEIQINGEKFYVTGILEEQGSSMMGSDDEKVWIPLATGLRMAHSTSARSYTLSAESPETVDAAIDKMETMLFEKYGDEDDYRVFDQSSILETLDETTAMLTALLGGIAAISLIVGGIGIMNIMLVSVTERTREIGIRKAIGAQRKDILIQFLIESVVVSGLGGLIGIVLGYIATKGIGNMMDMTAEVSPMIVLISLGFSMIIGVGFGLYPANKASKLIPIQALRYE